MPRHTCAWQLRIGGDLLAQRLLGRGARPDDRRIGEGVELAAGALDRILQAVQQPVGDARLFRAPRRELGEDAAQLGIVDELARQQHVAAELERCDGFQAIGRSRVAGHECQIARPRILLGMAQVVRAGVERLVAVIGAQIGDIEAVARKFEIVGIAAERGDRLLGREHEAQIVVATVSVTMIDAAVVKLDDIAALAFIAAGAFLLDGRRHRLEGGAEVIALAGGLLVDALGHIRDGNELVDLGVRTFALIARCPGVEARGDEVLRRRR